MLKQFKRGIDILGNVACICICAILLMGFVNYWRASRQGAPPARPTVRLGLRLGDQYPNLQGVDFRQHKLSILLFLSSNCAHCLESAPAYSNLQKIADGRPSGSVALMGVFAGGKDEVEEFRARGLSIPTREGISFSGYGISSKPTIVAVGENGRVENFWIGDLSNAALREPTQLIESAS